MGGGAEVIQVFSGTPHYTTVYNQQTHLWETTLTQGSFIRDMQASIWLNVPVNSQYFIMIRDEEQYHAQQQMENSNHARWGTAFIVANVMNSIQANEPYTHTDEIQSLVLAQHAFLAARNSEEQRSYNYLNGLDIICADETEAKAAVDATHRLAMPCAYPNCP